MSLGHPGGGGAVVHCDGAALAYGRAVALTGVTGEVGPGTALALIGPNGSGKTTLLRGLLGMVDVVAGRIEVCGRAPGRARRGSIGYVPQVADLDPAFPVTVLDVVLMGITASMARLGALPLLGARRREARRRALAALESVGLAEAAGRRFGTLSGGQQQRVLVARCIAARPRLIALDEPFNGLDQPNRDALLRIIAALKDDGVALVISTHDLVIARECCEQVALLAGRQIAFGPREEVLVPGLIEQAYGAGASGRDDLLLGAEEAR